MDYWKWYPLDLFSAVGRIFSIYIGPILFHTIEYMGIIKLLFQKVVKSEDIREFPKMTIKMSSL